MARFLRSRSQRLVSIGEVQTVSIRADDIGGRALGLVRAAELGLTVPPSWVLPAEAFREICRAELPSGHDPQSLLKIIDRPRGVERAARARERLLGVPLPASITADLAALWEDLDDLDEASEPEVVVWSSPTCESDAVAYASGLQRSFSGIRSLDALTDAIRALWSLAVLEGSLSQLKSARVRDVAQAVVVQSLSQPARAGTLLTRLPGGASEPAVSAWVHQRGLEPAVHDGVSQASWVRFSATGSILERAAQPAEETSQTRISALARIVEVLERDDPTGPRAVDVAFADADDEPIVLAVSDAARMAALAGGDAETLWSLASLGEVLPGVPSPLTWSLARPFIEASYGEALLATGAKPMKGQRVAAGLDGRFYYNLSALLEAVERVPGVDLGDVLELIEGVERPGLLAHFRERDGSSLTRIPFTVARFLTEQRRLAGAMVEFEERVESRRRWLAELDLAILPDDALGTTLREAHNFFEATARLSLDCASALVSSHVVLKTVLGRTRPVQAEHLAQTLVAGTGEVATIQPTLALADVVQSVKGDQPCAELLREALDSPTRTLDLPEGPGQRAVRAFLDRFGHRGPREEELMSPRWREAPETLMQLIALQLDHPPEPTRALSAARAGSDRLLAELEQQLTRVELGLVRTLVKRCRRFIRLREQSRVWLAKTAAMLRTVVLDVDRRLHRIDSDFPEGGAFFCTYDELRSAVRSQRADLGPIVRMRIDEMDARLARPDPPASFLGSPVPSVIPPRQRTVLQGVPGAGGQATGTARRVGPGLEGIAQVRPGDILVTRSADLALGPLLPLVSGLVVEIGGPLSHLALLAREMAVPAAVNVRDSVALLCSGEPLRIDGDRGTVERLRPVN